MNHRTAALAATALTATLFFAPKAQAQEGALLQPESVVITVSAQPTPIAPISVTPAQPPSVQLARELPMVDEAPSRGANIALETLAGAGGLIGGGFVGFGLGMGLGLAFDAANASRCTSSLCGGSGPLGMMVGTGLGAAALAPLGVGLAAWGAGRAMGGQGRVGFTVLGSYTGLAAGGLVTLALSGASQGSGGGAAVGAVLTLVLTVGGGTLAFELDHRNQLANGARVARRRPAGSQTLVLPYLAHDGVGITGVF